MLPAGSEYRSARGTRLEILESSRDALRAQRTLPDRTGRALRHLHLDYHQTFRCLDGRVEIEVGGRRSAMAEGDVVEIEPETPHRDPWNVSGAPATIQFEIRPQPRFIEIYAATYAELLERGRLNRQDEFTLPQALAMLDAGDAESFAAGPPIGLQRALRRPLGRIGRLLGARPVLS